ncbi:MAG: 1-deoxy-D-xylulose-5-phosphate synthase [Clostridia bacterium]
MGQSILDDTLSSKDLSDMDIDKMNELAGEIRNFLIDNISKTGGHLASNLGVVELMLAIHKVFDTEKDRLVLDVGHQCYVHKMLTGRRDGFENLRKFGGMSGFLRPNESVHDAAVSGHASNSVSLALGMARARTLMHDDYNVIALIGDGALTGGLAFEALNDAGQSREPMVVILNDNEMSITKNVGAITQYLAKLRVKPHYLHFKDRYRKIVNCVPGGRAFDKYIHAIKNSFKNTFIPASLFENMGFIYLGPADGHDLKYLIYLLELAVYLRRPVLIHVTTTKGKGYRFSEENPQAFHGVSKFDIDSGEPDVHKGKSFSSTFGDTMCALALENKRVCAITAAMASGVGLTGFARDFKSRFFDVGIAEGHAVTMAAGLAKQGMVPVCAIYSTFLQRAYDMIIHDVAISGLHVVFAVDRAGLVGEDGETHHGVFDVAYLSSVPGMTVLCPANFIELEAMLRYAVNDMNGPITVRYNRGSEGELRRNTYEKLQDYAVLRDGHDITLVGYGVMINELILASNECEKRGISCEIIKINKIAPLDISGVSKSVLKTKKLIVCEDCVNTGSVGERVLAGLEKANIQCKAVLLNTGDRFITNGETQKLWNFCGIDCSAICTAIMEVCGNE